MEAAGTVDESKDDWITVAGAILKFTTDDTVRNLAAPTLNKYRMLLGPPSETTRDRSATDHLERFPVPLQVLKFSGLRIGDVCALARNDLVKGRLWVDNAKTGVKVYVPLPEAEAGASARTRAPAPRIAANRLRPESSGIPRCRQTAPEIRASRVMRKHLIRGDEDRALRLAEYQA